MAILHITLPYNALILFIEYESVGLDVADMLVNIHHPSPSSSQVAFTDGKLLISEIQNYLLGDVILELHLLVLSMEATASIHWFSCQKQRGSN